MTVNTWKYLLTKTRYDDRNGHVGITEWGGMLRSEFRKPSKPKINLRAPDGFRKPSSYAAGTDKLLLAGSVYGVDNSTRYITETYSGTVGLFSRLDLNNLSPSVNSINHIRTKILNNIKDEILDASMVLAEMQSTVKTVSGLLDRVGRSMLAIKKRKPESFYYLLNGRRRDRRRPTDKFLRQTASEFLQWKYGITPSVMDLNGALEGLDVNQEGSLFSNPPLLVARSNLKTTENTSLYFEGFFWKTVPCVITTEYKARCDFSVNAEGLRGLSRYGLGLSTIPTLLWDKSPFTFVLDMAIPISSLIKAWGALTGVDVRGYCETHYVEHSCPAHTHPISNIGPAHILAEFQKGSCVNFNRTAYSTVPMPLPFIKNPISVGNMSTILALFTSLRK